MAKTPAQKYQDLEVRAKARYSADVAHAQATLTGKRLTNKLATLDLRLAHKMAGYPIKMKIDAACKVAQKLVKDAGLIEAGGVLMDPVSVYLRPLDGYTFTKHLSASGMALYGNEYKPEEPIFYIKEEREPLYYARGESDEAKEFLKSATMGLEVYALDKTRDLTPEVDALETALKAAGVSYLKMGTRFMAVL